MYNDKICSSMDAESGKIMKMQDNMKKNYYVVMESGWSCHNVDIE